MTIKEVLKDYVIENGGVTQGKSTSELLKEAIGEVIPAPEENADPNTGGDNADPNTGGDNADPNTGGDNADPNTGGDNADPNTGGDNGTT